MRAILLTLIFILSVNPSFGLGPLNNWNEIRQIENRHLLKHKENKHWQLSYQSKKIEGKKVYHQNSFKGILKAKRATLKSIGIKNWTIKREKINSHMALFSGTYQDQQNRKTWFSEIHSIDDKNVEYQALLVSRKSASLDELERELKSMMGQKEAR